jgi:hypothetical protein
MTEHHPPYWRRAHHDWKFWLGLVLMLAAISMFALRRDMILLPGH